MTGCHDGTEDGFLAADYESVMQSVVPGKPRSSKLYTVLIDIHGEDFMPPDQPLTKDQRMLIEIWIAQGALHTTCPADTNGGGGGGGNKDSVCFTQDILPMMVSSCGTIGCHDVTTHEDDYIFVDYATITSKGIVPFDPDDSEVMEVVTTTGEDLMPPPPLSPLSTTQIANLRKWISDGALNSDCPEAACDTIENIGYADQIVPIMQANCIGCHNNNVANGNVNLTSYDHVKTYATTIRNNQPLLTAVVRKLPGFVEMPPTFSLDEC